MVVVVIGDLMNDVVVRPLAPMAHDTDTPSTVSWSAGGSGANQAAWLAELGVPARLAARAGRADAGRHREILAGAGVDARLGEDPELATGTVVVVVGADGSRSMFTDRGANRNLDSSDLTADLLEGAVRLHLSGYCLVEPSGREAVGELCRAARAVGVPVSVDPGSVSELERLGAQRFIEAVAGADLIFPNLEEGRLLSGCGPGEDSRVVLRRLLDRFEVVAMKLGAAGSVIGRRDRRPVPVPAVPVPVVDPTGAGDAYCAGFLSVWHPGADLASVGRVAAAAAARAVSTVGARPRRHAGDY
jgi:sugar/nucleoside kinase (ribokinase family)